MQDRIEKVAGAVSGEGTARAIGAVRAGCKSEDEDARFRVAEGWYGTAPILPVGVGATTRAGNLAAMGAKARTKIAVYDAGVERMQGSGF
jgi:hypothetical protein